LFLFEVHIIVFIHCHFCFNEEIIEFIHPIFTKSFPHILLLYVRESTAEKVDIILSVAFWASFGLFLFFGNKILLHLLLLLPFALRSFKILNQVISLKKLGLVEEIDFKAITILVLIFVRNLLLFFLSITVNHIVLRF